MIDPIGAFNRIRDFYISYLETAFYIRDSAISRERRDLLEAAGSLCTEPIIEPITRYATSNFKLQDLVHDRAIDERLPGFSPREREAFVHLALAGLFEVVQQTGKAGIPRARHAPYLHQAEMLRRGVLAGNPTIVTSGTGSGKTEAFLLPVLAQLAREAIRWRAPEPSFLSRRWWQDSAGNPVASYTALSNRPLAANPNGSPFHPQREGEKRPAAVRALILYPMNALVEDQLARLRRALDSPDARACMGRFFNGNRIFLGKYTSATPVTGHHYDPTPGPDEYKRRERKLKKLFKAVCEMQATHEAAGGHADPDARYLFPSVDGDEMTSRWDMQQHPPDILITNTSMLNAMLAREVDSPIFAQTRDWLLSTDDSYFFLVLDELHLQRGSSGTELSFLLRLLIERLGLDDIRHRHKLRILASSASLPLEGEAGKASLQYLWDFFGSNGSWSRADEAGNRTKENWRACVLPGYPVADAAEDTILRPGPFIDFLAAFRLREDALATAVPPEEIESSWRAASTELAPDTTSLALADVVKTCIEKAGLRLEGACRNEAAGAKRRPVTVNTICRNLFGEDTPQARQAVRGLLVMRGLGDSFRTWFPNSDPLETVSFRVHLFFRSIEGLFAPALLGDVAKPPLERHLIGPLTVERGLRFVTVDGAERRLLELVYCECCGDLFFAGMKGKRRDSSVLELLPIDPDLDGLPDSASSQLFEELSADMFGVFWPREVVPAAGTALGAALNDWRRASLNPITGVVKLASNRSDPWADPAEIHGYLYDRNPTRLDRHHRSGADPGSCVPYACPSCGTSYEFRKKGYRLSPLRNFRTGFAKTTQLLATEVFEVLRQGTAEPKLVSFSDSRQDAAKAALDIERRHHEDLARQILVEAIREIAGNKVSAGDLRAALQANKAEIVALDEDDPRQDQLMVESRRLRALLKHAEDAAIPLAEIVETLDDAAGFQGLLPDRKTLRPYLRRFVELGVHPVDPTGARKFKIGDEWRPRHNWYEFFTAVNGHFDWKDVPAQRNDIDDVRREIVRESLDTIAQAIFNKTYFSLEETGLGYATVPLSAVRNEEDQDVLAAYVRVLSDSYRLNESKYDGAKDWTDVQDIGPTERVLRFATAIFGDTALARAELRRILAVLDAQKHTGGIIYTGKLSIRVPKASDPYWRCLRCGRVHLHKGVGICTRCFTALESSPSGLIEDVRRTNFLGKRVERGEPVFRVRCEELTGQTDDPAERQRRFRGILFPAPTALEARARFIDLLAVTTTMEVGIDIGPLRAVFQANMPPQRFNYQQRVGRAGRRGQAFSSVMTVCRSKSHDLYYFRHPDRITGDPPPPPFLTKRQVIIARRLLRKAWLAKAFENIRSAYRCNGVPYPGDDASPDIHGEFIPSGHYFDAAQNWPDVLRTELTATTADRNRFAAVLAADSEISIADLLSNLEPEDVISEIGNAKNLLANDVRDGLAHTLAEAGLLPMFGMPTRVRSLYVDTLDDDDHQREWSTIDRDLDLAIFEFAPGSVIVKDKQQHRAIGFTGQLEDPFRPGSKANPREITPYTPAFGDPFWLVQCKRCGSWHRFNAKPANEECKTCRYILPDDEAGECVTPAGFRTNLQPGLINENDRFGSKHRSITAEFRELQLHDGGSNISIDFLRQARTYRLNRGGDQPGNTGGQPIAGFNVDGYGHTVPGLRYTRLIRQSIATDLVPPNGYQPDAAGISRTNAWLAAAKTTDSLFVAVTAVPPGLRLERVSGENRVITSVRAAALSATFIIVHRAALDLDIDPEEFDIIDPRVHMANGSTVPVLQITDHLVNGSGFCEHLAMADSTGEPYITKMIRSAVRDAAAFPLKEYRGVKNGSDHATQCDQSCYLCLQRYGNQSYHGLLDWRLGLSFLEALDKPDFACGLDGNFDTSPSLADWPVLAKRYATALVNNYRSDGEVIEIGKLTAFRFDRHQNRWALVVHPLWDTDNPSGILDEAIRRLGIPPEFADTFELSRRQVLTREKLRREWNR